MRLNLNRYFLHICTLSLSKYSLNSYYIYIIYNNSYIIPSSVNNNNNNNDESMFESIFIIYIIVCLKMFGFLWC